MAEPTDDDTLRRIKRQLSPPKNRKVKSNGKDNEDDYKEWIGKEIEIVLHPSWTVYGVLIKVSKYTLKIRDNNGKASLLNKSQIIRTRLCER